MWRQELPQRQSEGRTGWVGRVIRRLQQVYQRYGYGSILSGRMGRTVEPQIAGPGDRLLDPPNPPPHSENGDSPSSTYKRSEGHGTPSATTGESSGEAGE